MFLARISKDAKIPFKNLAVTFFLSTFAGNFRQAGYFRIRKVHKYASDVVGNRGEYSCYSGIKTIAVIVVEKANESKPKRIVMTIRYSCSDAVEFVRMKEPS